ncbi:MAG: hypothetical protein ACRC6V_13215 [Bacteroidales bacterium]
MSNKIVLSRIDTYTHAELFDTSAAWDRILSLMVDDIINLEDEDLTNLVYDTISDLSTSAKEDVTQLLKDEHIGSMFVLEYEG